MRNRMTEIQSEMVHFCHAMLLNTSLSSLQVLRAAVPQRSSAAKLLESHENLMTNLFLNAFPIFSKLLLQNFPLEFLQCRILSEGP